MEAALKALQRVVPEAPAEASAARAWAEARGYEWGDDEASLVAFLECETRCATLIAAKEFRAAPEGALRRSRAVALARELGASEEECGTTASALAAAVAAAEAGGPSLGAEPRGATAEQRATLETVAEAMRSDYALRRQMALKRCDVTVQSFLWSDAARGRESTIVSAVAATRDAIPSNPPPYTVDDFLAMSRHRTVALADTMKYPSTKNSRNGVESSMKSVIIGAVPNRGGHAHKQRPSDRDMMPAQQQRTLHRAARHLPIATHIALPT